MKSYTTHWYTPPFDDCCVSHMSWMVCKYNTNTIHAPKLPTALSKPPTDREIKTTAGEGFQLKVCFHASRLFLEQNLQSGTHGALFVLWETFQQQAAQYRKLDLLACKYIPNGFFPCIRICAHEVKIFVTELYAPTVCPCLFPSPWKFTARRVWTLTTVAHSAQCSAMLALYWSSCWWFWFLIVWFNWIFYIYLAAYLCICVILYLLRQ